jgi:hypothetical protein
MRNSDMIEICQVTKTAVSRTNNLNDQQYENFILYNLVKNNSPDDISINSFSIPSPLGINNTNLDIQTDDPDNLKQHIIINNNDKYIQSEKFALDVKYADKPTSGTLPVGNFSIVGPYNNNNNISSNITLKSATRSYYDSNLRFDVSFNNREQYTDGSDYWTVQFDRRDNHMNYFAAINSHLSTSNADNDSEKYPFRFSEDFSANRLSLGVDGKYFTQSGYSQRVICDFSTNNLSLNTLDANSLELLVNPNYTNFNGSEFGTYKVIQEEQTSNIKLTTVNNNTQNVDSTGLYYPIGSSTGADIANGLIGYQDLFNFINTFDPSGSSKIVTGFSGTLNIIDGSGGYTCPANNKFTLDDKLLHPSGSDANLNYFINGKPSGRHFVDISKGSVMVDPANPNASYVSVSSDAETISGAGYGLNSTPGAIKIRPTVPSTRVNSVGQLASNIDVYYSQAEAGLADVLPESLKIAGDVYYDVKLVVESTANTLSETYSDIDTRNLAINTAKDINDPVNARLVIANDNKPVNFDIRTGTSFKFLDEDPSGNNIRKSGKINILNIENKNILVEDGSLCTTLVNGEIDATSSVPNVSCDVKLTNTDLTKMPYSDYRVKLTTKNATDLNTSTQPNNGWAFDLTTLQNDTLGLPSNVTGRLLGDSNHRSEIIKNVFSFLKGTTPMNVQYKLNVGSTASSLATINYTFDVSTNEVGSQTYTFGFNDTQFENVFNDISDQLLGEVPLADITAGNEQNKNEYIFERWLRKKQYRAVLDPSLPFYRNLILKTGIINEENLFYRAWKRLANNQKGLEISPILLESFTANGQTMNIVNVKLVNSFGSANINGTSSTLIDTQSSASPLVCNITLKPSDCGIFKAGLQGKDLSNNTWNDLGFNLASIDPYIQQNGNINNYNSNLITNFNCDIRVSFPLNVIVVEPNYYVDITNPLGDSMYSNITAKLYSFSANDISQNINLVNNFSPYSNQLSSSALNPNYLINTNYICDLSLNGSNYKITVSHRDNNQVLRKDVEIIFPKDYVLNFNIINSSNNLLSMTRQVDSMNPTLLGYNFATVEGVSNPRRLKVDDGVYMDLNSDIVSGMSQSFSLKRDQVTVKHVDNQSFIPVSPWFNGGNYQDIVLTNGQLVMENKPSNGINSTKSFILNRTRGYITNINDADDVTKGKIQILRTPTVYTFNLDASTNNIEKQIYSQSWVQGAGTFRISDLTSSVVIANQSGNWNNNKVVGSDSKVHLDIGLELNINQSMLADGDNNTLFEITVTPDEYNFEFKNPDPEDPLILNGTGSGNLFESSLPGFFDFKVRAVKTPYPIQIKIVYESSLIRVYTNPSYIGKPDTLGGWTELPTSPFAPAITSRGNAFTLHPTSKNSPYLLSLNKKQEVIGQFTSYFVCAPPSYKVEFNPLSHVVTDIPFVQTSQSRVSAYIDISKNFVQYDLYSVVGADTSKVGDNVLIKSPPSINLHNLRNSNSINRKNLIVKGNDLKISIYNGTTTGIPNTVILANEYNGIISDILNTADSSKFRSIINNNGEYDISYSQPLIDITQVVNDTFNINFTIDNAFVPAGISYLPLPINRASVVTLYDSRFHYGYNGKYYLFLNKYNLVSDGGVDYNALLAQNSNVRQVSFRLDTKSQKSVELYMLDNSNNRVLMNAINLSDASNINNLLENLNVNDLSGPWNETSLNATENVGISLAALDVAGMNGIRNLLVYKATDRLSNKTLFIKRDDIFRVLSAVGQPVLRITNSGNIITPKVTTSMVSLLQQSVVTSSRPDFELNPVSTGLFSEGALDFSGNWLH